MEKRIILFMSIITLILGVFPGCSVERKPKILITNMIAEVNEIRFDMEVNNNDTYINEITITIGKKNDTWATLNTRDGINFTGITRGVYFTNLEFNTQYIIRIVVDYTIG